MAGRKVGRIVAKGTAGASRHDVNLKGRGKGPHMPDLLCSKIRTQQRTTQCKICRFHCERISPPEIFVTPPQQVSEKISHSPLSLREADELLCQAVISRASSVAPKNSVRGEYFDWMRTGLSNPAASRVEPHELNSMKSRSHRQVRANRITGIQGTLHE
jgi:hypothetical protein